MANLEPKQPSAEFEYGPFGEVTRQTGAMAKGNPFRFSTKCQDDETDLLYYGYRYYNASTGRWVSRDPIQEKGGPNLYGFVHNDAAMNYDVHGLFWPFTTPKKRNCHGFCGPDATGAVQSVLKDLEQTFHSPTTTRGMRRKTCESLYNPETAEGAWDITVLAGMGMGKKVPPPGLGEDALGTGDCERTVVYRGQCVYASALNYLLFGKINSLCNQEYGNDPYNIPAYGDVRWTLQDAEWAVFYHKGIRRREHSDEAKQAGCFTRVGYGQGCACGGKNGSALSGCITSGRPAIPRPLYWHAGELNGGRQVGEGGS